ncbi:hypothetical protein DPEC_G00336080 [Dallia pectoralis]|uniref:Uncharacterized protein n=1 Tax=Dallia pectoralis TaxID=75939 RepID=A0ACC2F7H7_DALPE|nr:hypothetical protein DPEC_G00336080 [Dallia pectoralis]
MRLLTGYCARRCSCSRPFYQKSPGMIGQQKLLFLWAWMLLVASLCPGAVGKRGRGFGKGSGMEGKAPPSKSGGSSRQGLKMAGAAAAGALGGAAIGFGLGSLGKPRHGYEGHGRSNDAGAYNPGGRNNRAEWQRYKNAAGHRPTSSILLTLGSMVPILVVDWIRGI